MTRRSVGIVMNGVTGRMGRHQHLERSILAIRRQGGLPLADGSVAWPEPTLVGTATSWSCSRSTAPKRAPWPAYGAAASSTAA